MSQVVITGTGLFTLQHAIGNAALTRTAGSIVAFHRHRDDLPPGALGVVCSFGAGYSA